MEHRSFRSSNSIYAHDFGRRLVMTAFVAGVWLVGGLAHATEVPTIEHTIAGNFNGAGAVFAADVDGDGDIDILGAASNANDIIWWENPGGADTMDPTKWTEHTIKDEFSNAASVHAADVDRDGDTDILGAATGDNDITWWENTAGDGSAWTEHTIDTDFTDARSVFAADVDRDGNMDILGAASNLDDITWWENPGGADTTDPTKWTEHIIDGEFNGAFSVFAADVDRDGNIDILGTARDADDITWWENPGGAATTDGTVWTEHTIDAAFDNPRSVFAADVDKDGNIDTLGAARDDNAITWWENPGGAATTDGTVWTEHTIDGDFEDAFSVHAADVDGDGDIDILGAAEIADDITWWENPGGADTTDPTKWTEHTIDAEFDGARSVYAATADLDGDGDTDILGAGSDADDITWWENDTIHRNAVFPAEHTVDGNFDGAISVYAADVDGDGDLDVLGAAEGADDIAWWENTVGDGTAWTEHTVDGNFDRAASVYAADVDGDGDLDVLGAAGFDRDIAWFENTAGDGTAWTKHTVEGDFDGPVSVVAADVDGDGDLDVLGAALDGGDIAWWENTAGDGTAWTEHTVDANFDGANSVHAADMDGDGDLDVLGGASNDDEIAWWENTAGNGTAWSKHTVDGDFDGPVSVFATDVDGDGDLDVLGAAFSANDIAWWENTGGDGAAWTEHTVDGNFTGARAVVAADVDGDGDLDVLGAANLADDIAWWENRGGQFGLSTADTAAPVGQVGVLSEALKITTTHNGRTGDNPVELVTFDLLLEETAGVPLDDAEANGLLDSLRIYVDEPGAGAGSFQSAEDTQVASINPLSLTAGVQTVSFVDGDMHVEVPFGTDRCYFVVVEPGTGGMIPSFRITHLTMSTSTAEDGDFDIPLTLAYTPETTAVVVVNRAPVADAGPDNLVPAPSGGTAAVALDGSGSSDPDDDPLTYTWTGPFPEGGGTVMGEMAIVTLGPGVHTITLTVDDGRGGMDSDTVDVTVNQLPVADAGGGSAL